MGGYPCLLQCSAPTAPSARIGRNWDALNSPSWLGEGWRGHPIRAPNSASSLRRVLLPVLRKSFTRDNHPSPSDFHPPAGAAPKEKNKERHFLKPLLILPVSLVC